MRDSLDGYRRSMTEVKSMLETAKKANASIHETLSKIRDAIETHLIVQYGEQACSPFIDKEPDPAYGSSVPEIRFLRHLYEITYSHNRCTLDSSGENGG